MPVELLSGWMVVEAEGYQYRQRQYLPSLNFEQGDALVQPGEKKLPQEAGQLVGETEQQVPKVVKLVIQ